MTTSKYQKAIYNEIEFGTHNICVNAVAGSGKTTTSVNALSLIPSNSQSVFLAFNKAIVEELKTRVSSPNVEIKTLHSAGFQVLMRTYRSKLNNYKYRKFLNDSIFLLTKEITIDTNAEDVNQYKNRVLKLIDLARVNLAYDKNVIEAIADKHEIDVEFDEIEVAQKLMQWGQNVYKEVDFTDMIWMPVVKDLKIQQYDFVFVDEAQDLNNCQRELMLKMIKPNGGRFIAVGDPKQCQPKGSKVLMAESLIYKNIEDILPGDKVVTFTSKGSVFRGLNDSKYSEVVEAVAKRSVEEPIIKIITEKGKVSKYTYNHICLACLDNSKEDIKQYQVLYLMEKEGKFRIGTCKLWKSTGFGFSERVRAEKAERGWILKIYKNRTQAFIDEQYYSYVYQIPQLIFQDNNNLINYDQGELNKLWANLSENIELKAKALQLLKLFDKYYNYPIYENKYTNKCKKSLSVGVITEIYACNLFPEIFDVITLGEDRFEEEKNINRKINVLNRENRYERIINIEKELYEGEVYSLQISNDKNYISDNILTHNCINGFAGADIESFDKLRKMPNTIELPLSVCYRCGKKIIESAKLIVPYIEANETAIDGEVKTVTDLTEVTESDMILCRVSAPLVSVCMKFIAHGKPAYVKGKEIGSNLINLIKKTKQDDLMLMFDMLANELYKVALKISKKEGVSVDEAKDDYAYIALADKIECLRILSFGCSNSKDLMYRIEELFKDNSKGICLSTCHKSKGLEADNVYVIAPDKLPLKRCMNVEWKAEQEMNLLYVSITRAKKTLNWVDCDIDKLKVTK